MRLGANHVFAGDPLARVANQAVTSWAFRPVPAEG